MDAVYKYFNAEKLESLFFVLVGIISIGMSLYFLFSIKKPFYTGMSWPLILLACVEIAVGSIIYFRSPKDIERVNNMIQNEKSKISSEELPRMEVVMKNFVLYRYMEIIFVLLGLALIFFMQTDANLLWKGVGVGLTIQGSLALLLDYIAESRGKEYIEFLKLIV